MESLISHHLSRNLVLSDTNKCNINTIGFQPNPKDTHSPKYVIELGSKTVK